MQFDARIDGKLIHCRITSDRDLKAPVFCFSCMAPVTVVEGGTRIAATGGYTEVALPDLQAGQPHDVTLRHENPEFAPANRAWLPLGAYLRTQDGPLDLPALPDGVRPERRDTVAADWPRVCPRPTRAEAAADHLIATSFAAPASEPLSAADDLAARVGLGPFLSKDGARLSVELDETLPPEAYRLTVTPEGAKLRHGDRAGALHGAVTLLTLARNSRWAHPVRRNRGRTSLRLAWAAPGLRPAFLLGRHHPASAGPDGAAETESLSLAFRG